MSVIKTAKSSKEKGMRDDYLGLVIEFPIRPLRSETEFRRAGGMLDRFVGRDDLTAGQRDYVAALARFVQDYEQQTVHKQMKKLPPIELLKHLMRENRMTPSDLGRVLGSRGLASEVLSGKRGLSKSLIGKLAHRFRVEPSLFLDIHLMA